MSENSNNLEIFYKKKYYKYKNKYLIEKNKLDGGLITFKSGLFGFFVNECYAASLDINFVKDADAPSIYELNNKLHLDGYRMENNSDTLELLVDNKYRTREFMEILKPIMFVFGVIAIFAGGTSSLTMFNDSKKKTPKFTIPGRFIEKNKINLNKDDEIISLLQNLVCYDLALFFRIVKTTKTLDPNKNIDCCIIIDVDRTGKNKFKRIVRLPPPSNIVK